MEKKSDAETPLEEDKVTDEDLCAFLVEQLSLYPALLAALPPGYPAGLATNERMRQMDADRKKETGHWHLLNLPYALYLAGHPERPQLRDVATSILGKLDRFCVELSKIPGFPSVMKPLSSGLWKSDDPEFWSVLAHAYLALMLNDGQEYRVRGFSAPFPGGGAKNADILLGAPTGPDCYVDVVMKHRPKFTTAEEALTELHRHAEDKLGTKYGKALEGGIVAMVADVCVAKTAQLNVLRRDPTILASALGSALGRPPGSGASFFLFSAASQNGRWQLRLLSLKEWAALNRPPA